MDIAQNAPLIALISAVTALVIEATRWLHHRIRGGVVAGEVLDLTEPVCEPVRKAEFDRAMSAVQGQFDAQGQILSRVGAEVDRLHLRLHEVEDLNHQILDHLRGTGSARGGGR